MAFEDNVRTARTINGLDVTDGLNRFAGKENLYDKGLSLMFAKIESGAAKAEELYNAGDFKELGIHAHGLKGSLLNIGAKTLGEMAFGLEKAGKYDDPDYIKQNIGTFLEEFRSFGADLSKIYAPKEEQQTDPLTEVVRKMLAAASSFNYDGIYNGLDELLALKLTDEQTEAAKRIRAFVDDFDIEQAETELKKWIL
ncbi:MAG: Hpt domain-containing protein [Oscillospiraceae bacterium]|nr:Hpt domain-containing protein [Oscillospiraceae bacterium]